MSEHNIFAATIFGMSQGGMIFLAQPELKSSSLSQSSHSLRTPNEGILGLFIQYKNTTGPDIEVALTRPFFFVL